MNEKTERRSRLYLWLFLGWVLAIVIFSVIPLSKDLKDLYENRFVRGDYLLHCLVFLMGYLIYRLNVREVANAAGSSLPRVLLIVILVLALLAEAVQLVVPSRTFNLYDVLANYTGIGFGVAATIVLGLFERWRSQRQTIIREPLEKTGFPPSRE